MPKAKDLRISLSVNGETRRWALSWVQVDLLADEWTKEEAINYAGCRAVQQINGLVKGGLMRKVGLKWRRTALGARVLRQVYKG